MKSLKPFLRNCMLLVCLLFCLRTSNVLSQETDEEQNKIIEEKIENLSENAETEDADYSTLLDELNRYVEHPLNLNTATREEIEGMQLLSEMQINNLLEHIKNTGKLLMIYELQTVEGFDNETIKRIFPFVRVSPEDLIPRTTLKEIFMDSRQELYMRYQSWLENQAGFLLADSATLAASPNSHFLGSKSRIYSRYRFKYGNRLSIGITGEKDSGEEFFKGTQKNGFDFYSAHFYMKDFGLIKALAVGDFMGQFGQGLTFWSGYGYGKSPDAVQIKKNGIGLKPYTSVDENLFLRGGGVTLGIRNFSATSFYSQKKIDANIGIYDTLADEVQMVTSFQTTGYHTTPAEIADKDAIEEIIYGGNVSFTNRKYHFGLTVAGSQYGAELKRNLSFYNQFEFTGSENKVIGADYSATMHNVSLFGEISRSENGGLAYLNGLVTSIDPRVSVSVLHRNYQRNFQPVYSSAFSDNTKNINEQGLYFGAAVKLPHGFTITGYYDNVIFRWLKYQVDAPSYGSEELAQLNYTPSKKFDMYLRYRQRDKFKNSPSGIEEIDYIVPVKQVNYRYNVAYQVTRTLRFRNRIELLDYFVNNAPPLKGYLIYHDIILHPMGKPYTATFRYALFDTDNYDARIYMYESDLPGVYSLPSYYYKGGRAYLLLRYNPHRGVSLWLRYSRTFYSNRSTIGTGLYEIQGNAKSEIKAQVRFMF